MILSIEGNEYRLPERITIDKWKDIMKYDFARLDDQILIISVAFDIPPSDAEKVPEKTLEVGMYYLLQKMFPDKKIKDELINFQNLTIGDFIDLEIYYSKGMVKHIDDIIKKLYPTLKNHKYIDEIWWGVFAYFNYRKNIFIKYKNLFDIPDSEDEIREEDKNPTPPEYLWWEVIMVLANGEFLKIDEATKQPLFQALNYLAWDKDKKQKELNAIRNSKI